MDKKRMSVYGVGPIYVATIIIISLIFIILSETGILSTGKLHAVWQVATLAVIGSLMIVLGLYLWLPCAFGKNSVDKFINDDKLCDSGRYSIVRNPIYSGITFIVSGVLVATHNVWLLILPVIFYYGLTLLLICTEEKWLKEKFKEEFDNYCYDVHRLLPWKRKK